jgi:hypothetical protein
VETVKPYSAAASFSVSAESSAILLFGRLSPIETFNNLEEAAVTFFSRVDGAAFPVLPILPNGILKPINLGIGGRKIAGVSSRQNGFDWLVHV